MEQPSTSSTSEKVVENADESFTSLTGELDYEPELEFDDSELNPPSRPRSRLIDFDDSADMLRELSFTDDEDSFTLGSPYRRICEDDILANQRFVEVFGDDKFGRRIVVVSACRIPDTSVVSSDEVLHYFIRVLCRYVEQDYVLIYFHYGLKKSNRPPFTWYWNAYKEFDKKYKKNLKALYILHPTKIIKTILALLKPVVSIKFGRKINYYNYLYELREHINFGSINIPYEVIEHDNKMLALNAKATSEAIDRAGPMHDKPNTCEFGVTLKFIQQNNPKCKDSIPPVMRTCVEFLSQAHAIDTEGIFRRSCSPTTIAELQQSIRDNRELHFETPNAAAWLLKNFLRELKEPLLTCALYDDLITFSEWPVEDRLKKATTLIMEQLPFENYLVLNYLLDFLGKVKDRACMNKMNGSNLSIVFGPNLVWSANGITSMEHIQNINEFINFILENHKEIFIINSIG